MLKRTRCHGVDWVDLTSPTAEDIAVVERDFHIHPLVVEELSAPSLRPKVDVYQNFIYSILHFPIPHHARGKPDICEFDIVVGRDFIITAHYKDQETRLVSELEELTNHETKSQMQQDIPHAAYLLYLILRHFYHGVHADLESMDGDIAKIEEAIFSDREREMVSYIAAVNHQLLDAHRALKLHRSVLSSFMEASKEFFGTPFTHYMNSVVGTYDRVWHRIESYREMLSELRTTNDSLLSAKTNNTMKTLTIITALLLPPSFIAALFTIPASHIPVIDEAHDFWIIIGMMTICTILMVAYFKHKRWF